MKGKRSEKQLDRIAKYIFVFLACGGVPFFFIQGIWGELLLKAYLLTTFLLFVLLFSYWESTRELWFWKAMIPIMLVHSAIVFGLAKVNLEFPQIDRLPRATYGVLTGVLAAEVLGFMRIIEAYRRKGPSSR